MGNSLKFISVVIVFIIIISVKLYGFVDIDVWYTYFEKNFLVVMVLKVLHA